jgi:hypothetical protein
VNLPSRAPGRPRSNRRLIAPSAQQRASRQGCPLCAVAAAQRRKRWAAGLGTTGLRMVTKPTRPLPSRQSNGHLGPGHRAICISSVQTEVSAALTAFHFPVPGFTSVSMPSPHAHAPIRQPEAPLCKATVMIEPLCFIGFPFIVKV